VLTFLSHQEGLKLCNAFCISRPTLLDLFN
jgi:hypothetical protein